MEVTQLFFIPSTGSIQHKLKVPGISLKTSKADVANSTLIKITSLEVLLTIVINRRLITPEPKIWHRFHHVMRVGITTDFWGVTAAHIFGIDHPGA